MTWFVPCAISFSAVLHLAGDRRASNIPSIGQIDLVNQPVFGPFAEWSYVKRLRSQLDLSLATKINRQKGEDRIAIPEDNASFVNYLTDAQKAGEVHQVQLKAATDLSNLQAEIRYLSVQ